MPQRKRARFFSEDAYRSSGDEFNVDDEMSDDFDEDEDDIQDEELEVLESKENKHKATKGVKQRSKLAKQIKSKDRGKGRAP